MPRILKRNAVIVFGLAIIFYCVFMFAKHDPHLRSIIPFGDDPYDAIGSFAIIVGILVAILGLVRAFRPYRKEPPSKAQRVYLIRSQEAVVLAVLITVAADTVAMARHPSMLVGAASRELLALLSGITVVALGVHWLVRNSISHTTDADVKEWGKALLATILATSALALYPEQLIQHTATHLLTVAIGDFLLFAPMRVLLISLVPYRENVGLSGAAQQRGRLLVGWHQWSIVVLFGVLIGAFIFIGEMSEGSGRLPLVRLLFVASVYIGLTLVGLLVAYAFLASPLGLKARG